ncbi:Oligosaccaryltransferase [Phytophthora infestans]|uniref:Oligosaccaryltransferase n=1 Tax=Phytophthora infestans TaxID=4787 RepID=A0A8S9TUL8_PHYIN|nr:Oligosaccaryltransferase [Phytophthora infestans]
MSHNLCTTSNRPSRYIALATRLDRIARYNESSIMNNDEMDAALMVFVNCLGAVIMVSVVGFHYLTAKPKDADL